MNFWATWCHPCEREIPDLSKVYDAYKDKGVVFLGVLRATDPPRRPAAQLRVRPRDDLPDRARERRHLVVVQLSAGKLPTTFVFGRDGKQELKRIGQVHEDEMRRLLDKLVAEKPPA